jgi:16S rRNA processing protein RimM
MVDASKQFFEGEELVVAGRVRRVFGVKGQLSVDWNNGVSPVPVETGNVYLRAGKEGPIEKFELVRDHRHGNHNIITLNGLVSRTDAEKYRGSDLWVEKKSLPPLKDNEYYTYQLIEMRVETTNGEHLGEIKEIFSTGSNDVYVVRKGDDEILIPATEDVIVEIDLEGGVMKINMVEGLV